MARYRYMIEGHTDGLLKRCQQPMCTSPQSSSLSLIPRAPAPRVSLWERCLRWLPKWGRGRKSQVASVDRHSEPRIARTQHAHITHCLPHSLTEPYLRGPTTNHHGTRPTGTSHPQAQGHQETGEVSCREGRSPEDLRQEGREEEGISVLEFTVKSPASPGFRM